MSDLFNFKIDSADYLGIDHEEFKTNMLQLALTKPTEYFELRKVVLQTVKREAVKAQYEIYYRLMTDGSSILDHDAGTVAGAAGKDVFRPSIPKQKVNEFALKAAKTIDAIAEEAIEMILPMNYKKISDQRTMQHTAGNLGFASSSGLGSSLGLGSGGGGGVGESKGD